MSKLRNKSIQVGAENHEDDLEMADFLDSEMERIDKCVPYRVWLKSAPGFYAQYDGKVDVSASSDHDAKWAALRKLKRGAFPDRDSSMWIVTKIERLG